jgi:hypothetical protein
MFFELSLWLVKCEVCERGVSIFECGYQKIGIQCPCKDGKTNNAPKVESMDNCGGHKGPYAFCCGKHMLYCWWLWRDSPKSESMDKCGATQGRDPMLLGWHTYDWLFVNLEGQPDQIESHFLYIKSARTGDPIINIWLGGYLK